MRSEIKYYSVIFVLIVGFLLSASNLQCNEREDRDFFVIIKLYENQQNDLALKQIKSFELNYLNSKYINQVYFIKANILLENNELNQADSLYSILIKANIEPKVLADVYINMALIRFKNNDYIKANQFLFRSSQVAYDINQKYKIEFLKGKIQNKLYNPKQAALHFETALSYMQSNPDATYELLNTYITISAKDKAKLLITGTLDKNIEINKFTNSINTYLDYLISKDEFSEIMQLKDKYFSKVGQTNDAIDLRFAKVLFLINDLNAAQTILSQAKSHQAFRQYLSALILLKLGETSRADSIFSNLVTGSFSDQDVLPGDKDDISISSWLERIKILYTKQPDNALRELSNYIANNDNEDIDAKILFTYGSLLFKSKQYQDAASVLIKLKLTYSSSELDENIQIMLGDIWFNARVMDSAKQAYNIYLNLYPKGKHRIHALYNIALIDFEKKDYNSSKATLNTIIAKSDDQDTNDKAIFMLAEIAFFEADYQNAINKYNALKGTKISAYSINYRIAQSLYFIEDYKQANEYLDEFLKTSSNAKDVLILQGNISFNLKQYERALSIYNKVLTYDLNNDEKREIKSYIALTLYRLKRFEEASKLYLELSKDKESPEAYLIMAAKASYHAKDSHQALILFKQFISENPSSPFFNNAMATVGSIYYNLGNFNLAMDTWIRLLNRFKDNTYFTDDEQIILSSLFSGLQFCLKTKSNQAVLDKLNNSIDTFKSEYIRFELQYLLLKIYFGEEMWSDILDLADNLRKEFPQKENNEIRQLVAGSLTKLNRFTEADSVFREIYTIEPTADILTEWAELDIKAGQFESAIQKLDNALNLEKTPNRFAKLLTSAYQYPNIKLDVYWRKWSTSINPIPDRAYYIWLKWNYDYGNWGDAIKIANNLLFSLDYDVSANAQLYKSLSLYQQDSDDALLELYKTVYLFSDALEVNLQAKKHIVMLYIKLGQTSDAQKVYAEIRESLTTMDRAMIDDLFNKN